MIKKISLIFSLFFLINNANSQDSRYARFIAQSYGKNLSLFAQERGILEFQQRFQQYINDFQKHYNTESESEYRASKFLYNLEFIQRQNSYYEQRRIPFRLRLNQFADENINENTVRKQKTFVFVPSQFNNDNVIQSDNENISERNELDKKPSMTNAAGQFDDNSQVLPIQFDWREQGILTPIKNQGDCGSCWALASLSVVESVNALANNSLRIASNEQVMDCVRPPAFQSRGCDGGAPLEAFDFVQRFGVAWSSKYVTESSNDLNGVGRGEQGTCHDVTLPANKLWIDYYRLARRLSDRRIMELVQKNGPIAAIINAGDEDFTFYGEGVITSTGDTSFDTPYNHLINIVGWGNDNGLNYWLIRNSWSQTWGEAGFGRLLRGINNRGINNFIIYAGVSNRKVPQDLSPASSSELPSPFHITTDRPNSSGLALTFKHNVSRIEFLITNLICCCFSLILSFYSCFNFN